MLEEITGRNQMQCFTAIEIKQKEIKNIKNIDKE